MEMNQVNINDIYDLDYENKICLDCKAAMPKYVSINNAIIICQSCALKHKALGFNISYIRDIKSEWDPYLIAFIHRGGNARFIRFTHEYEIELFPIEYKYITKAAEYYRLLIKSEVIAEEPPEKILKENGTQYCNLTECFFPEFENYQLYTGQEAQMDDNQSYSWKIYHSIKSVRKELGNVCNAISESHMKDKVIAGSSMTYNALAVAGNFLFKQSKPLMKFISIKATQGIGLLYNQMKDNLDDEQKDIDSKDNINNDSNNEIEDSSFSLIEEPKKETVKKKKKSKRVRGIRPKSKGKELIQTSTMKGLELRSNSNHQKDSMQNLQTNKLIIEKPIEGIAMDKYNDTNTKDLTIIHYYNDFNHINDVTNLNHNEITTSIINNMDNIAFVPNSNYPSYEEIIKKESLNFNDAYPNYEHNQYQNLANLENKDSDQVSHNINEY